MATREEIDAAKAYLLQQQAPAQQGGTSRAEIESAKEYLRSQNSEPSFWKTYVTANKNLNKRMAQGVLGLPDLVSGGAASRGARELGVNLTPEEQQYEEGALGNLAGAAERIAGHGAEFVGAGATGMGAGTGLARALPTVAKYLPQVAKSIPYVSNPVGKVAGWTPHILGAPRGAKEVAAMTGLGGGLGALSGVLQEASVPQGIADIGVSLLPFGVASAKWATRKWQGRNAEFEKMGQAKLRDIVGEENVPEALAAIESYKSPVEGYKPTTAETINSPALNKVELGKMGVLRELSIRNAEQNAALQGTLRETAPYEQGMPAVREHLQELGEGLKESRGRLAQHTTQRAEQALEGVGPRMTPESTGKVVGGSLIAKEEAREAARRKATKPLYEKMQKAKEGIATSEGTSILDTELESAKGVTKKQLLRIKNDLGRNKIENIKVDPKIVAAQKEYDQMMTLGKNGSLAAKYYPNGRPEIPVPDMNPTPLELDKAITEIGDMIATANKNGARGRATILGKVKTGLEKDLADFTEARTMYAKKSEGMQKGHKQIGQAMKKDKFKKEFTTLRSELPHKLIDDALVTPENARTYMSEIKGDKAALQATEQYLNFKAVQEITDAGGRVIPTKIDGWIKKNPNYALLSPHLGTRLRNLQNAQMMANQTIAKNEKAIADYYNKTASTVLKASPDKVIGRTLQTANPEAKFRELKGLVKNNPAADQGLQRGMVDHILKTIKVAGVDSKNLNKLSFKEMENFVTTHKPSLQEVFDPAQVKNIENVAEVMRNKNRVLTKEPVASDTFANFTVAEAAKLAGENELKKMVGKSTFKGRFAHQVLEFFKKTKDLGTEQIFNKALLEPEYAKLLLSKPFSSPAASKSFLEQMNKSYLAPVVTERFLKEEE